MFSIFSDSQFIHNIVRLIIPDTSFFWQKYIL